MTFAKHPVGLAPTPVPPPPDALPPHVPPPDVLPPDALLPDAPPLAAEPLPPARGRLSRRRILIGLAAAAALAGCAYVGWLYWTQWRFEVSTDDAYVQADVITISPQVPGYIAQVLVTDNQPVKAGDLLAVIDQRDYIAAVDQSKANVASAEADIANSRALLDQQQANIAEAQAAITVDRAAETYAEQNNQRYSQLAHDGFGSVQNAQMAASQIDQAKAGVVKDQAALDAAVKQVDTLKAQLQKSEAGLAQQKAALEQSQINLGYTRIVAPADGTVGNRVLRVGQYVQPGTQLLAVVPLGATYVIANFKETQLAGVKPGQKVDVEVDAFPGQVAHGVVNSLAPASGEVFALLPPDNATGNFTKIVQRIPVKITFDPKDPLLGRMRPGMSVTPTVDLRTEAETVR